ncbi:MAG: SUMF1/EgtB/PvdO family nonheme iron enzyme [Acidobacteriota bacterium]
MPGIFISYRREDAGGYARGIADRLKQELDVPIFMDIDAIDPGADFVEAIEKAVGSCHVLIALIGTRWLDATDEDGQRRLNDPMDFIRLEIATALERNVEVIPVLLRGARMPRESDLPKPLKSLTRRQALKVSDERWDYDMGRLVQAVERSTTEFVLNGVKYEFVKIPAGEFDMGSNNGEDEEMPVRKVRISHSFQLGKYPVTQEQWKAVMGNNPSSFKGASRPVEQVSWDDVQEFLGKLKRCSDGFEYRLPTEAEWEFAARAGTTGDYAGNLDEMGWYEANSGGETHPVGEKKPNAWGLYDMHGNVWEWVHDWFSHYGSRPNPDADPPGPASGSLRVVRGGSWAARHCPSALRNRAEPGSRSSNLGFRPLRQAR